MSGYAVTGGRRSQADVNLPCYDMVSWNIKSTVHLTVTCFLVKVSMILSESIRNIMVLEPPPTS